MANMMELSELLLTRFCHDMAGPISAVNNGLEFLGDEGDKAMREQALDLLQLSAKEAFVKLQMYRIAYGRASAASDTSTQETRDIAHTYFSQSKMTLDWPASGAQAFPERITSEDRQLLISALLNCSTLLIYGGTLRVRYTQESGRDIFTFVMHAQRLKDPSDLITFLRAKNEDEMTLSPSTVTFSFLRQLALERGVEITSQIESDTVTLVFILPKRMA
jgi:histidine phosphotransferase ChpT